MKTFIINLPNAKDRLKSISKQLDNLNIPFEVFEAVYWKDLTQKQLKELYDSKKANNYLWRDLTLWEIWCSLSHIWIFKKIVEEKINIALILEDDVLISKEIKKIYDLLNKNGTKYDYLSLYYENFDWKEINKYHKYIYQNFFKNWKILKYFVHLFWMIIFSFIDHILLFLSKIFWTFTIRKYKAAYSTCWYFITHNWAKKLLKIHDKVFVPSDWLPQKFWESVWLKFWITIPRLLDPWISKSCIDELWKRP